MAKSTRQEILIKQLRARISTARTKEILLLNQLIDLKEEFRKYKEDHVHANVSN